jgi:hypothetical protein
MRHHRREPAGRGYPLSGFSGVLKSLVISTSLSKRLLLVAGFWRMNGRFRPVPGVRVLACFDP